VMNMKEYKASIEIHASAANIWAILVDARRWPEWDSNFDKIDGKIGLGERLTIFSKVMQGRPVSVIVAELVPNRQMTWTSGMPLGLFRGRHSWTLTERSDGTTQFVSYETFTGILSPLIEKSIPDMTPSFNDFVSRLKCRAETEL